jgi:hypothetical protein
MGSNAIIFVASYDLKQSLDEAMTGLGILVVKKSDRTDPSEMTEQHSRRERSAEKS